MGHAVISLSSSEVIVVAIQNLAKSNGNPAGRSAIPRGRKIAAKARVRGYESGLAVQTRAECCPNRPRNQRHHRSLDSELDYRKERQCRYTSALLPRTGTRWHRFHRRSLEGFHQFWRLFWRITEPAEHGLTAAVAYPTAARRICLLPRHVAPVVVQGISCHGHISQRCNSVLAAMRKERRCIEHHPILDGGVAVHLRNFSWSIGR